MGQAASTEALACVNQAACVIEVLGHTETCDSRMSQNGQVKKEANMTRLHLAASKAALSTTSKVSMSSAMEVEKEKESEPAASIAAVKCRKCAIIGVDPDKYCLHLTAKNAQDVEQPNYDISSLPEGKEAALIWHMLSNLSVIRRFKIQRHAVLNLVNGLEYVYKELDMSEEWLKALELAHGIYIILRRRKENAEILNEFFYQNNVKSAPSLGEGISRLQALTLILSALAVGLHGVSGQLQQRVEKYLGAEQQSRKSFAWSVVHKTGKAILNRLLESEEQRVETIFNGVVRIMSDPTDLEDYAQEDVKRPRLSENGRRRGSFDAVVNPSWNGMAEHGPSSPVTSRRPQAGDLHDTYTRIEPVSSKLDLIDEGVPDTDVEMSSEWHVVPSS